MALARRPHAPSNFSAPAVARRGLKLNKRKRDQSISRGANYREGAEGGSGGRGNGGGRRHHAEVEEADESQVVYHHGRSSAEYGDGVEIKRLDPQTKIYFLEIASLIKNSSSVYSDADGEGSIDEAESICAQALEESSGQELQLACDPSCGRILETILLRAGVSAIVQFVLRCGGGGGSVAVGMVLDSSGSHILEAALRTIARALLLDNENVEEEEWYGPLKLALSTLCQGLGAKAVEIMTNRYGSHVLRCVLSLLSGDFSEILLQAGTGTLGGKSSRSLADKLGAYANRSKFGTLNHPKGRAFPALLNSFVNEILKRSEGKIAELRADASAGPVLQGLLKALKGKQEPVVRVIAIILGCDAGSSLQDGVALENASVEEVIAVMEDRNGSHLMEVVIQSAPTSLYLEIFQRFFRKRLLQLSLHPSANFIVQVLIANARHEAQVNMMFDELEGSFSDLVRNKRSGVIAALIAACARFHTREKEACRSLMAVVNPNRTTAPEEPVLRFLQLESSTLQDENFTSFNMNAKMSVIGSVILQTILTFPKESTQQFCASIAAMESDNLLCTARDASGCRVLESFLQSSSAPAKHKYRVISKLEGHFAELAVHAIGCFTVEKCFGAADMRRKEMIAAELAPIESELSKSRNGTHISRRCDIAGYVRQPEQWRRRESSKNSIHKAFSSLFSPGVAMVEEPEVLDEPEQEDALFVKKISNAVRREDTGDVDHSLANLNKRRRKDVQSK